MAKKILVEVDIKSLIIDLIGKGQARPTPSLMYIFQKRYIIALANNLQSLLRPKVYKTW